MNGPSLITKLTSWLPIPILGEWAASRTVNYTIGQKELFVDPAKFLGHFSIKRGVAYGTPFLSYLGYELLKLHNIINEIPFIEQAKEFILLQWYDLSR